MNIAFMAAYQDGRNVDCVVFHDVDLIPEDDRNVYLCPAMPRHMSAAIDEMNYQLVLHFIQSFHSSNYYVCS